MSQPTLRLIGDAYFVVWTTPPIALEFAHLRHGSDGLSAEITTTATDTGWVHWARVNLGSSQSRAAYVKALSHGHPSETWPDMIATACLEVARAARVGEPALSVTAEPSPEARWLLPGLIPLGETSVMFGDGGTGKSLWSLALAAAGLTGIPLAGQSRWQVASLTRVLYLDWESLRSDHGARLWGLLTPLGARTDGILHRSMSRGLAEDIPAIRQIVAREAVDLVIVDSLGAACGAEPEGADAAVRTMNALRSLAPATRLVIAHVSKAAAEASHGPARPYGSVYVANLARSVIEVRRDETAPEAELVCTYHHRKANLGRLQAARALRWCFEDNGYIRVSSAEPDLSRAHLPAQIIDALAHGALSVTSLADQLGESIGSVRTTLNRLAKRNIVLRVVEGGKGKADETLWGRALP